MEPCIHDSMGRWSEWGDSFAFSSPGEENRCVAAVETGGIYQLNNHLWEEKLAVMIEKVKREIAVEKDKLKAAT